MNDKPQQKIRPAGKVIHFFLANKQLLCYTCLCNSDSSDLPPSGFPR